MHPITKDAGASQSPLTTFAVLETSISTLNSPSTISINLSDIPKLTRDGSTYEARRISIQAIFLIFDLSSTIRPPASPPASPVATQAPSSPRPNVFLTSSQKIQLATINPASNTTSVSRSAVLSEQDDIDNDETYQEYKEDMRRELRRDDDKARDLEDGELSKIEDMRMGETAARDLWVYLEESMK
ncbi:hypothetical protein IFR04_002562 [Cadophora malorum]|uniref:Uncharacterized protein n=1 Tax=Cadophora malorum TaxID=108018 RepID=A0A8H7WGI1_9HELO|nr:hypothetical protein IFR04_002562 [Cadophora malorum]